MVKEDEKKDKANKKSEKPGKQVKEDVKGTPIDWKPLFAWTVIVILLGAFGFLAVDYFFPAPETNAQGDEVVGTYGPFDVYKKSEHDYYIQLNSELVWHFRANPLDTVSIPVYPYKKNLKQALEGVNETWIVISPQEESRIVASAVEVSKTLGAKGYTVKRGWSSQPEICKTQPNNTVCSEPVIPLDFANENRTVFTLIGPADEPPKPAIYVVGNNIALQAPTYDELDMVVDKAALIMLNLA